MFLYSKLSSLKIYRSCYCFFSINQQSGPQIYSKSKLCSYNQVVLKEHLVLTLFRDEYDLLHEDYQLYLLPSILEFEKLVKSGRAKQKYADLEYNVAKQVEKMIRHMKK
ncbi:probable protein NAP1 isoform X3 [Zingiber officinale]|uniref:probable protein NAP1 isoform X3 n=1 Tax=Zingiber officinale TaxID=94328 RepID=UPI001C4D816B|nr:probable protein NAP1 isoform X3 [Zingiber officinale]